MSLPKTVQVLSFEYLVRYPKDAADSLELADNWGITAHDRQCILMKSGQAPACAADTLLHEVLHACWFNSGNSAKFSKDEEEFAIRSLTPILLDTLRRNPKLVQFLLGAA